MLNSCLACNYGGFGFLTPWRDRRDEDGVTSPGQESALRAPMGVGETLAK